MSEIRMADAKDDEARIRERAYHLWEADGRPHGREREFWERAEELVGIECSAEIQENYGEAPGRFTDQGDRPKTPKPRARTSRTAKPRQSTKPASEEVAT
jgi:DUF2934 family protein